jgi:hypothetical protein
VAAVEAQALSGIASAAVAKASASAGIASGQVAQATAAAAMASSTVAQASADAAQSTGTAAQVTASAAMSSGVVAQASADAAMATGQTAQATAFLADGSRPGGRSVWGSSLSITNIGSSAYGAIQRGLKGNGTMSIGIFSSGAAQFLYSADPDAAAIIGAYSPGSMQIGEVQGVMIIGESVSGAMQQGYVTATAAATNNGTGSLQLLNLQGGEKAITTSGGTASMLLGAGVSSNKHAIVAGNAQHSHGDGSITAGGGFYGSGTGITGLTPSQIGASWHTNTVITSVLTNDTGAVTGIVSQAIIYLGAP